jgi:hypothetical protein
MAIVAVVVARGSNPGLNPISLMNQADREKQHVE